MWSRRAATFNELGAKLLRECYASQCPCRQPSLVRTHGSWSCRSLSTAAEDTVRNQPSQATGQQQQQQQPTAPQSKLQFLGDASSFTNAARPMLGAPIDSTLARAPPAPDKQPTLQPVTFEDYAARALQPFEEHNVPEVALSMMGKSLDDAIEVLEDLVVNCLAATKTLRKRNTDPEIQRTQLKHHFETKLKDLLESTGFRNLLNLLVHESSTASNHQLIRTMAALSNFSEEECIIAIKPIVERLAKPIKPVMGRLSTGELTAFFHTYSVFQISDATAWKEAMNQINNRFNLFEVGDLTQLMVSLTKAPYLADTVSYFLTKLSVRVHPLMTGMSPDALVNTLKAYKTTALSDRKGPSSKFRNHALTELMARFTELPDTLVYDVVVTMMESAEKSSGLGACLDTYLKDNYRLWSQESLLVFLKYMYAAGAVPSPVIVDSLLIKIFELVKTSSPKAYMEAACFLADHGMLSRTLAMVISKELADNPQRLNNIDLMQLSKVVGVIKNVDQNPLPRQIPRHLCKYLPAMGYDDQLHAIEALHSMGSHDERLITTLDEQLMSDLAKIPLNLKSVLFSYFRGAQEAGIPGAEELVEKCAGDLSGLSLPWDMSMRILHSFQTAPPAGGLSDQMSNLRHVAARSGLDQFMTTKEIGVSAIDHLWLAIVSFSHDHDNLNDVDRDLYERLLRCVGKLPVLSMESQTAAKGELIYQLITTLYNLVDLETTAGAESLEMESVMGLLHLPLSLRVAWLRDTKTDQFFDILKIVAKCLKDHPVDLKSWLSSLQVHGTALIPDMTSHDAARMLQLFADVGSVHVQLLRTFITRYRFLLFVFSAQELLTIVHCFSDAQYNPDQFLGLCMEHLLMHLSRLSADEMCQVISIAGLIGNNGHGLLQSCPDLVRRSVSKYSFEQLVQCARSYAAAGYPSKIIIDLACDAALPVLRSGTPLERVKACAPAYFSTMMTVPLKPVFHTAVLECLSDSTVKEVSTSAAPMHHQYSAGVLALCQNGHVDNELLAHVFDEATLRKLFVVEEGETRKIPEAVLDTFRDLYDVVQTHPLCTATIDDELAEQCGFADRAIKEQDLLASGILEENTFAYDDQGIVWPMRMGVLAESRRKINLLSENIYRRLLPTPFGIVHLLVARDAEGKLVELPEVNPELSLPEWSKQLRDSSPVLSDPNTTVYALFCPAAVPVIGSAYGRLELWLSLLEANNIYPLAFTAQSFTQCTPEFKDKFVGLVLDPSQFSVANLPLCWPRNPKQPQQPSKATGAKTAAAAAAAAPPPPPAEAAAPPPPPPAEAAAAAAAAPPPPPAEAAAEAAAAEATKAENPPDSAVPLHDGSTAV